MSDQVSSKEQALLFLISLQYRILTKTMAEAELNALVTAMNPFLHKPEEVDAGLGFAEGSKSKLELLIELGKRDPSQVALLIYKEFSSSNKRRLYQVGIFTLHELLAMNELTFLSATKPMGSAPNLRRIKKVLAQFGLSLGMKDPFSAHVAYDAVFPFPEEWMEPEERVSREGLSSRAQDVLNDYHVRSVRQFVTIREHQISSLRGVGSTTILEIKQWLEKQGLRLGMTLDECDTVLNEKRRARKGL